MLKLDFFKKNIILIAGILIILVISYFIIKPFLVAVASSFILAYIFHPLYKVIEKKLKNKTIASLITIAIILLVIVIPLTVMIRGLVLESYGLYKSGTVSIEGIKAYIGETAYEYLSEIFSSATETIYKAAYSLLLKVPKFIIDFFIMFFIMFYLFKDWNNLKELIQKWIKKKKKEKIFLHLKEVTNSILYGYFITGLIEGAFATAGFYIFGVPNPVFWGFVIFVLAIIPGIGASIVWIPAALWLVFKAKYLLSILLAIYFSLLVSGIETFVRPLLISKFTKIHPVTVILGLFGGIALMGPIGIILGPLTLSIFVALLEYTIKQEAK